MSGTAFLRARDFLLAHRDDYETAYREFRSPVLDRFNWALDYFDPMAMGNNRPGLWIVDEGGGETQLRFAELAERSSRLANHLRSLGVRRGDRLLMMLGNVAPLWECMLAAMKLGAVVIPATTLLTRDDLLDRFARGRVRHVVAGADNAAKFADLPGDYTRIAVGGSVPGWASWEAGYDAPAEFVPDGETRATDPLLLYFTSGTTAKPKLVLHSHQSYPVGHLSTMYYLGVKPGDIHLNISSPGWAKHAYSCVFAPWNAGATVFMLNQPRFNAKRAARRAGALLCDYLLRATNGVAHADPGEFEGRGMSACARRSAPGSRSIPKSSSRSGLPGASPFATAMARPRRRCRSAIFPGKRSSPDRWAKRRRAIVCGWSMPPAPSSRKPRCAWRSIRRRSG